MGTVDPGMQFIHDLVFLVSIKHWPEINTWCSFSSGNNHSSRACLKTYHNRPSMLTSPHILPKSEISCSSVKLFASLAGDGVNLCFCFLKVWGQDAKELEEHNVILSHFMAGCLGKRSSVSTIRKSHSIYSTDRFVSRRFGNQFRLSVRWPCLLRNSSRYILLTSERVYSDTLKLRVDWVI